jgi:hypothetical protein
MLSAGDADKENDPYNCLKYSGEDIALIGEQTELTNEAEDVTFKVSTDEAQRRLIWLANWFLSGVVSCELWKTEVISKINTPKDERKSFFRWADPSDLAFLCVIYIHNYKRWIKTYELKAGSTRILTKEEKREVDKLGEYGKDGVSSKEGVAKLRKLQLYIGRMFVKRVQEKVKFDSAFWDYYDTHVAPKVRQQRNIDAPSQTEVTPQDRRKQKEDEQLQEETVEMLYCTYNDYGCSPTESATAKV